MIQSFGMSDVGLVRSNNEDSYLLKPDLGLYVVADGMGGALAGERASRIAVETVAQEIARAGLEASSEVLLGAVSLANENIRWEAEQNAQYSGMGTTIVAVLVRPPKAIIASVGDSRVYLRTSGELYCVTSDQTWVNEVGRGLGLSDEQLRVHPYRNVLTMAVGAEEKIDVQLHEVGFRQGDLMLLSSDGLHGVAGENALIEILGRETPLREMGKALIDAALRNGGTDNVTAVLISCTGDNGSQDGAS